MKNNVTARITCPNCLAIVGNPNAPVATEPLDVLPVDQEAEKDLRGVVRALAILAALLLIGGMAASSFGVDVLASVLAIAGTGVAVVAVAEFQRLPKILEPKQELKQEPPAPLPAFESKVLDYGHRKYALASDERPRMSMGAFILGFFAAIAVGGIGFFIMGLTASQRFSTGEREVVVALVVAAVMGLILGAIRVRRAPGYSGFGPGVAVGLLLAMMALGPCAFCYLTTPGY